MDRLEDTLAEGIDQAGGRLAPRWVAPLFLLFAIGLIPWIVYLGFSLPARTVATHYRTSWVGFDLFLVLAMSRTAWLAFKGRREMEFPAFATAVLLVVDAWFDVTTSHPGWPMIEAIMLAVFVELPTAALAVYIARHVDRIATAQELDAGARAGATASSQKAEEAREARWHRAAVACDREEDPQAGF